MVTLARRAQRIPFAPVVGVLFGVAAAILVAAVPQSMFEASVVASGLPTVLEAASPPLGLIARLLVIVGAFAGVALASWAVLTPLGRKFESKARARTPWHDAGYDVESGGLANEASPGRRPIFAPDELGAPLMSDAAIMAAPISSDETPVPPPAPMPEMPVPMPATAEDSIAALIRRLEDGLARRSDNSSDPGGAGGQVLPLSHSWIVPDNVQAPLTPDAAQNEGRSSNTFRKLALG